MFAKRLKELRIENHVSQAKLASELDISNRTISMYEQGNSEPNVEILVKIADYFNVTADYLTGKTNVRNIKYDNINKTLGLSDAAISVIQKCNFLNYNISEFIENPVFIKLMEAYSEYILLVNLPDPIDSYEYGYDSFDMNDSLDVLQKNFLDHLQDMPNKEAYQIYINSLLQKLLNSTE